jgi:hypothetical protein
MAAPDLSDWLVAVLFLQGLKHSLIFGCCPRFQLLEFRALEIVVDQRAKGARTIAPPVDREGGGIDVGLLDAFLVALAD